MLCALFARLWNGECSCLDEGMSKVGPAVNFVGVRAQSAKLVVVSRKRRPEDFVVPRPYECRRARCTEFQHLFDEHNNYATATSFNESTRDYYIAEVSRAQRRPLRIDSSG